MTREEAIKVLEMFLHKQCDLKRTEFAYDANTVWDAVNMASEALEQEPAAEIKLSKINFIIEDKTTASNYKVEQIKGVLDEER